MGLLTSPGTRTRDKWKPQVMPSPDIPPYRALQTRNRGGAIKRCLGYGQGGPLDEAKEMAPTPIMRGVASAKRCRSHHPISEAISKTHDLITDQS